MNLSRAVTLIKQIARLVKDGEELNGEPFEMRVDDAAQTLGRLIDEARAALLKPGATKPLALIVAGNPVDGLKFYGPFLDAQTAHEAAGELRGEDYWWVAELNP